MTALFTEVVSACLCMIIEPSKLGVCEKDREVSADDTPNSSLRAMPRRILFKHATQPRTFRLLKGNNLFSFEADGVFFHISVQSLRVER